MRGVNKVVLIGNLGADPETRTLRSGATTTRIRMATSKSWKDKDTGNMAEKTEWHTVNFWGRLAEVAAEYLRKGKPVYVEGELETRRWTDRNGVERFSTEIRALELQLLGSRNRDPAEARAPGDGAGPYGDDNIPY